MQRFADRDFMSIAPLVSSLGDSINLRLQPGIDFDQLCLAKLDFRQITDVGTLDRLTRELRCAPRCPNLGADVFSSHRLVHN